MSGITAASLKAEVGVTGESQAVSALHNVHGAAEQVRQSFSHSLISGMAMGVGMGLLHEATGALGGIKNAIMGNVAAGIDYNATLETATISMTTLLHSETAAKDMMAQIQGFAKVTPFELPTINSAATSLIAFGTKAKDVIPTLRTLGDTASGLGLGGEGLSSLVNIFGKIQMQGKLTGRTLMELTLNHVNAMKYLVASTGMTSAEVTKAITKGTISAADAEKAIFAGMNKDFGGLMAKQSQSWSGILINIKDGVNEFRATALAPLFDDLKAVGGAIATWMGGPAAKKMSEELAADLKSILPTADELKVKVTGILDKLSSLDLSKGVGGVAGLFKSISSGLMAIPWGEAGTFLKDLVTAAGGGIMETLKAIPWGTVSDAMKIAGQATKMALDAFNSLPGPIKTALIAAYAVNKFTGGAIGSLVGLGSNLIGMGGAAAVGAGAAETGVAGAAGAAGAGIGATVLAPVAIAAASVAGIAWAANNFGTETSQGKNAIVQGLAAEQAKGWQTMLTNLPGVVASMSNIQNADPFTKFAASITGNDLDAMGKRTLLTQMGGVMGGLTQMTRDQLNQAMAGFSDVAKKANEMGWKDVAAAANIDLNAAIVLLAHTPLTVAPTTGVKGAATANQREDRQAAVWQDALGVLHTDWKAAHALLAKYTDAPNISKLLAEMNRTGKGTVTEKITISQDMLAYLTNNLNRNAPHALASATGDLALLKTALTEATKAGAPTSQLNALSASISALQASITEYTTHPPKTTVEVHDSRPPQQINSTVTVNLDGRQVASNTVNRTLQTSGRNSVYAI